MNDTRKKIAKLRGESDSLKLKDGKTKDRVETWRKGVSALTNDLKAQVNILEDLDNG